MQTIKQAIGQQATPQPDFQARIGMGCAARCAAAVLLTMAQGAWAQQSDASVNSAVQVQGYSALNKQNAGVGNATGNATGKASVGNATQVQAGALNLQDLAAGNASGTARSNAKVGAAVQVQAGALNKQSSAIGNASGRGQSDALADPKAARDPCEAKDRGEHEHQG